MNVNVQCQCGKKCKNGHGLRTHQGHCRLYKKVEKPAAVKPAAGAGPVLADGKRILFSASRRCDVSDKLADLRYLKGCSPTQMKDFKSTLAELTDDGVGALVLDLKSRVRQGEELTVEVRHNLFSTLAHTS